MKCIDFDKEFKRYVTDYMARNKARFKNYDEMEAEMPQVYEEFLALPADWLAGETPGEYFEQFDDPKLLVDWMEDYIKQRIPLPDMLLNRVAEVPACEGRLHNILLKPRAPMEAKMTAVTLLRQMDSRAPLDFYVELQKNRGDHEDELADNALESLEAMGEYALPAMREALKGASPAGQEALLSLLTLFPEQCECYELTEKLFRERADRRAVLAAYLGRLNDARALDLLIPAAASAETPYLDYIELRAAIERLGGDAPERSFEQDPAYEAMRKMQ